MRALKLNDFLPYRLSIASNRVSAAIASTYQALFGLKIPEWRLITIIAEGPGITQQALGLATRMDKVTVSRAAATLVERGLVERQPNPGDQRSHMLTLTRTGRALYDDVAPKALELEAKVFAGFSTAEIATFRAMLARIEASAARFDPERTDSRSSLAPLDIGGVNSSGIASGGLDGGGLDRSGEVGLEARSPPQTKNDFRGGN